MPNPDMAIVRLGPVVSGISGAIGGLVFVSGRNGTVVRPRPQPSHKGGPFIATARASMYNLRRAWSNLTTLQQNAWRTRANDFNTTNALGQSSPINGFQLFLKVNLESRLDSADFLPDPKEFPVSNAPLNVTAAFSAAAAFDVTATPNPPPTFGTYYVYGWPFWVDHDTRSVARLVFLASIFAITLNRNVRPEWELHFGSMVQNQRFTLAVGWARSLAFRSPLVIVRGTVAA
ncbi:hypothetical protein LCGC14_1225180 [marine sediment metagenome]|uniref:Uncharacterized protein n=1 Tax=marine sediment metagenome TaxID=412755 RepID=A0A0F9LA69_9ZZZZ